MSTIKLMLKLWSKLIIWHMKWLECQGVERMRKTATTSNGNRDKAANRTGKGILAILL
jgi:hypothetical protein